MFLSDPFSPFLASYLPPPQFPQPPASFLLNFRAGPLLLRHLALPPLPPPVSAAAAVQARTRPPKPIGARSSARSPELPAPLDLDRGSPSDALSRSAGESACLLSSPEPPSPPSQVAASAVSRLALLLPHCLSLFRRLPPPPELRARRRRPDLVAGAPPTSSRGRIRLRAVRIGPLQPPRTVSRLLRRPRLAAARRKHCRRSLPLLRVRVSARGRCLAGPQPSRRPPRPSSSRTGPQPTSFGFVPEL
ncbi:WAS/WASL-interacting protein family member 1-like [Triticum dicoccoides]|uniref:WAS/WASL-interacting protein family member 1-like n=1 Tax=Triticum dicoccoides TaxID=85692 RepID=UPI00188EFE30|nr:WAS/WASL-interacting protein family member 1-like [Triticum dicoccoides]XP_044359724.1 WAS/WASL-interacting protein family member 1-like [Triticum aestivum]